MEALLNVIAIIAACLLLYRITVSPGHPIFNFSDRISERGLLYKVSELGSSCAATERGGGVDVRKVRSSLYKIYAQLKKIKNGGNDLDSAQKAFFANAHKITAAADMARRKLRFGYLLGSVGNYPRLFLFCNELIESTSGCLSKKMLSAAVRTFNAKAPLTFTELKFLPYMLDFCLCGLVSQVARSVQARSEVYRRGISDGAVGRADIDSLDKADYVCGLFSSVGSDDERSVMRIAESNEIDCAAAWRERNKFLAKATATILSAVSSLSVAHDHTDETLLELSSVNEILDALPSYSDCDTRTKTLYLSKIEKDAVKRRTSEAVIAHECADTVKITRCDVADHILGSLPSDIVGCIGVALAASIAAIAITVVCVNLSKDFIALAIGAFFIVYTAVGRALVYVLAERVERERPKLRMDKIDKRAVITVFRRLNDIEDIKSAFEALENLSMDNSDGHFGYALIFTATSHDTLRTLARDIAARYDDLADKNRTVVLVKISERSAGADIADICDIFARKHLSDYSFTLGDDYDYDYAVTLDGRVRSVNASDMLCEIAHPYCRAVALACDGNSSGKFYSPSSFCGVDWGAVFARGDYRKIGIFDIYGMEEYACGAESIGLIAASCRYAKFNGMLGSDPHREFFAAAEGSARDLDVSRRILFSRKKHSGMRLNGYYVFFALQKSIEHVLPLAHIAAILTLCVKFSWLAFAAYASVFAVDFFIAVYSAGAQLSVRPFMRALGAVVNYLLQPMWVVIRVLGALKVFLGKSFDIERKRNLCVAVAVQALFGTVVILTSALSGGGVPMILLGGAQMLASLFIVINVPFKSVNPRGKQQKTSGEKNDAVSEEACPQDRFFGGETEYKAGLYGNGEVFATADNRGLIEVRHNGTVYPIDVRLYVSGTSLCLRSCCGVLRRHCAEYFKTCDILTFRTELFIPSDGTCCVLGVVLTNRSDKNAVVSLAAETTADGYLGMAEQPSAEGGAVTFAQRNGYAGLYMSNGQARCEKKDGDDERISLCVSRTVDLCAFESKKLNIALIFDTDARAIDRCAAVIDSDGYYEYALTTAAVYSENMPQTMSGLAQKLRGDFESDGRICDVRLPTVTVDAEESGYGVVADIIRLHDHLDFNTVVVGTDRSRLYDIANKHKDRITFIDSKYATDLAQRAKDISVVKNFSDKRGLYAINEFGAEFAHAVSVRDRSDCEAVGCLSLQPEYDVTLGHSGFGFLSDGAIAVDPTVTKGRCGNVLCGGALCVRLGDGGGMSEFCVGARSFTRFRIGEVVIPSAFVVMESGDEVWSPTYYPLGKGRLYAKHGFGYSEFGCDFYGFTIENKQFAVRGKNAELFYLTVKNTVDAPRSLDVMFAVSSCADKPCGIKFDGNNLTLVNKNDGHGFSVSSSLPISEWCAHAEGYCKFGKVDRASRFRRGGVELAPAISAHMELLPYESKTITFCLSLYDDMGGAAEIDTSAAEAYFLREAEFYSKFKDIELLSTDKLLNNVYHRALYSAYSAFMSERDGHRIMSLTDKLACCFAVKYADINAVRSFITQLCSIQNGNGAFYGSSSDKIVLNVEDARIAELLFPIVVKDFVDFSGEFKLLAQKTCSETNGDETVCVSVMERCMTVIDKYVDPVYLAGISDEYDHFYALLLYCCIKAFIDYCPSGARKNRFKAASVKLRTVCESYFEEARRIGGNNDLRVFSQAVAAYCGLQADNDRSALTAQRADTSVANGGDHGKYGNDRILLGALSAFTLYSNEQYDRAYAYLADVARNIADSFASEGDSGTHAVAYAMFYVTLTEKLLGIKKRGKRTRIDPCTAENTPHMEFYLSGQDGKAHIVIDDSVSDGPWHIRSENIVYATDCVKPDGYPASLVLFRRGNGDGI